LGSVFSAATAEKRLQRGAALGFQHSRQRFGTMVESRVVEDREHRLTTALGIGHAPNHKRHPGQHDGAGAHGAGFFGDVQDRVKQAPVAERRRSLGQRDHFRMRGGVTQHLCLIVGAGQHADRGEGNGGVRWTPDDYAAGRDLLRGLGTRCFPQSLTHEMGMEIGRQHAGIVGGRRRDVKAGFPFLMRSDRNGIIRGMGMTRMYTPTGDAGAAALLAFVTAAIREGAAVAVAPEHVPVLTRFAGCRTHGRGAAAGRYVFRAPRPERPVFTTAERVLAGFLLIALLPLLGLIALLILVTDGPPVLFRQIRFGEDGRPFVFLKFRTMCRASEWLHAHLQHRQTEPGRLFKLENDPRVTRFGALLRNTFLDEFPQLLNVVRGEMRLVGPRPLPQSDQHHYTRPEHAMRLKGRPGMTGLWQVAGRNRRTFDEMCLLDLYYLGNRSVTLDLWVLGRTLILIAQQIGLGGKAQQPGE